MKLVLAGDHRGHNAVKQLADRLRSQGHDITVTGCTTGESCDYPDPAYQVGVCVTKGDCERGILICGSGVGMSIAANKIKGVRAALVHDELTAQMSRSHNDANVLCLSADLLGQRLIEKITDIFVATAFEGGRHERRTRKITAIEEGKDPTTIS